MPSRSSASLLRIKLIEQRRQLDLQVGVLTRNKHEHGDNDVEIIGTMDEITKYLSRASTLTENLIEHLDLYLRQR